MQAPSVCAVCRKSPRDGKSPPAPACLAAFRPAVTPVQAQARLRGGLLPGELVA